jgi:hypothetical protein
MKSRSLAALTLVLFLAGCTAPQPEAVYSLPHTFDRPMVWSGVRVSGGEDPHAYGISVELWKQDGSIAGFIQEYVGPPADAPAGRLEKITLDVQSGALSFVAKLSVGVVLSDDGKSWVPARNEYSFSGTVNENTIEGTLKRRNLQPDGEATLEEESLTLERDRSSHAEAVAYADWLNTWIAILQVRGPRW